MTLLERLKEAALSNAVSASIASLMVLLGWIFTEISPALIPAIEAVATTRLLLSILGLSLLINLVLLTLIWLLSRNKLMKLRFGIYWDNNKNPHCPICEKPLSVHSPHGRLENEYFCKEHGINYLTDKYGDLVTRKYAISNL